MPDVMDEGSGKVKLTREQKTGLVLLLIFAACAIGLGVMQIRNTINAPFALGSGIPDYIAAEINTPETLAYRDTDNDGLNDFEELYVYQTSPYLVDTDSDGIPDKQEVMMNTDPLCPRGQQCNAPVPSAEGLAVNSTTIYSLDYDERTVQTIAEARAQLAAGRAELLNRMSTPEGLKGILRENGFKEEDIAALTDEQLLAIGQGVIDKNRGVFYDETSTLGIAVPGVNISDLPSGAGSAPATVAETVPTVDVGTPLSLKNFPPELVEQLSDPKKARELLIKEGADPNVINSVSDADLMSMLAKTLGVLDGVIGQQNAVQLPSSTAR